MTLFLLFFFTIYGSAHFYVFSRIKAAFPLITTIQQTGLILLMLFMILAPILVRVSERYGYESTACALSYIGYIWMGILFLFFVMSLFFDVYRLLVYLAGQISRTNLSSLIPPPLYLFVIPLAVSVAVNAYGYFEAKNIRTETITIQTSKISREIGRIRIVQISDVHIGMIIREKRLENIVAAIKQAEPDLVVSTGDLLDGQIDNIAAAADLLREIRPKYGKFAIMGNHEFFAGIAAALAFHERAGFRVLRGEALTLADPVGIAGVDDATGSSFGDYRYVPEKELLAKLPKETFRLLLKHRPDIEPESPGLFDLQLSGHTHRGQIYPFVWMTRLVFPYHSGYYLLPNDSRLYVNRGAGTWGPPVRFFSPPEVTVIDLMHKSGG
ncbi:MAG: metallophosphoesterase [Syntrophus sp. (in: bacteria)]|nr:metallophosphoesterase [Syntrophus sp. (in: bacteria)]